MRFRRPPAIALLIALTATVGSCAGPGSGPKAAVSIPPPGIEETGPRDYPGIRNAVAYHEGFISGGVPEGEAGFDTLAAMGVKTIISVDGAVPEVEAARARGMRYIHLPIGYNGFDEARRVELARAAQEALENGPVYIHCHHGKHRSAGAAAAIAVSLGWDTADEAVARMKVSGTAPGYRGLYACVANAGVLSASALAAARAEFPEVSRPTDFVQTMVELDEVMEHLKAIERAGWRTPPDHPDLVPAAEAGRAADLLRVLAAGGRARERGADFAAMMVENSARAGTLEEMLVSGGAGLDRTGPARLSEQLARVSASCKDCHVKHRD